MVVVVVVVALHKECWLEIFTHAQKPHYPLVSIAAPAKVKFELRAVVWDAKGMKGVDLGGMNDLYITGHLVYRDKRNRLVEVMRSTDTHYRAKNGKGCFNYRLVWPDLELPMDAAGGADSDYPRFFLKAWDWDLCASTRREAWL